MVNNGSIFRVPKPFQAGVVFGSIPERLAEGFYAHNPKAMEGLIGGLMTAAGSQTLLPNAFGPIVSQMNNRDSFTGRTLIPGYAEKFLPEYQFTPYTSDTAKTVGRLMSAFPGMEKAAMGGGFMGGVAHALTSPALIDNYIRAWTGNLGEYALQAAGYGLRKSGLNEAAGVQGSGERPEWKLSDVPGVRAFVARYPGATSQNVEDFYSDYFKAKSYHDTLNGEANNGNVQAIREITATGENERFEALDGLYKSLSNQLKMVRWIDQNPKVAAYEKRQLIDQLYFGVLRTADQGAAILKQMKK
jgi:hypothetical protein